jgi:hypothetical protein
MHVCTFLVRAGQATQATLFFTPRPGTSVQLPTSLQDNFLSITVLSLVALCSVSISLPKPHEITPMVLSASVVFLPATTNPLPATTDVPQPGQSPNNTLIMSASPNRKKNSRDSSRDAYRPQIVTTIGAKPACLVNASVTYVGNNLIYAFGGFDQYTDEGVFGMTFQSSQHLTSR